MVFLDRRYKISLLGALKSFINLVFSFFSLQFVEKEHTLVNVHKESRLAIETEKKLKETLESKNKELSQKLQTIENEAIIQKTKIQELENKV